MTRTRLALHSALVVALLMLASPAYAQGVPSISEALDGLTGRGGDRSGPRDNRRLNDERERRLDAERRDLRERERNLERRERGEDRRRDRRREERYRY